MIIMDIKGGSWVGGVYQRLEAMCVEVEEVICEDTLKYVENQVRTVGDTVKKFYSDVLEDLRSPTSLDAEKEDILLTAVDCKDDMKSCKKQNSDDETEPADAASERLVKNNAAACNNTKNYRCCSSAIYRVIKPCEPKIVTMSAGEKYDVNSRSHDTELTSSNRITSVTEDVDCRKDSQNNCVSNSESISSTGTDNSDVFSNDDIEEPSTVHENASVKGASEVSSNEEVNDVSRETLEGCGCDEVVKENKTNMLSDGNLSDDSKVSSTKAEFCTMSTTSKVNDSTVDEELFMVDAEKSSPSPSWDIRRYDADTLGALVGERFNKVKLEESCVLVENHVLSSKSALPQNQKSYKKKIQDVFSPRRWSKGKRDEEVLAAWYEEQFAKDSSSTCIAQVEIPKSQVSEPLESDWELL